MKEGTATVKGRSKIYCCGQRRSENFVKEFVRRWRSVVCCKISVEVSFTLMFPSQLSHAKLH